MRRSIIALSLAAVFGGWIAGAQAQTYPTKPIRIIIGFAAGGPTDVIGRVLAKDMSIALNQQVIVENRTGANALVATEMVARAEPDGYTLLFNSLNHSVNPILMKEVKYHPVRDFSPVTLAAILPSVLVTRPDAPFNTVQELVQLARAKPEEVSYGSAGNGGSAHISGALLATLSGTKMTHVPFRGNAPALTEVMGGRISFMFYPMVGVADQVAGKQLKVLAATTPKRHPDFPTVPTMSEAGFPGYDETVSWVGLLAPPNTPEAIVNALHDAVAKSLASPETKERLKTLGAVIAGGGPKEFTDFLVKDSERWARVIASTGIKGE